MLPQLIYNSKTPADVDYTAYGISGAVVIDNTGIWRDAKGLGQHLQSKGVDKVGPHTRGACSGTCD